jgi:small conductance mechanosensitive channel
LAIARYQTLSQRASGAASALPAAPNGRVTAPGSNSVTRAESPHSAAAPAPAAHTSSRETHSAAHASATAPRRSAATRAAGVVTGSSTAAWIPSRRMPALIVAAKSFSARYGNDIKAALILIGTFVLAYVVDRTLKGRARRMAAAVAGGELSPVLDTRLRFLRRVAGAVIIVIGLALAVAQFTELHRLASTILASSAIAAAVIGFAARQVLANAIAGLMIAITQPLRIGDLVTFEEQTGTVEDISLTYTWLRMGSGARLIIPNERLAAGVLRNDSIRSATVALEVTVWLAPDGDETAAIEALEALEDARTVRIADVTEEGVSVLVAGPPVAPSDRLAREAALRAAALRALREAGIPRPGHG